MRRRVKGSSATSAVASSPVISICVLDRDTRYLAASPGYAKLCGAALHVVTGKPMLDFCPPELVANARRDSARSMPVKAFLSIRSHFAGGTFSCR